MLKLEDVYISEIVINIFHLRVRFLEIIDLFLVLRVFLCYQNQANTSIQQNMIPYLLRQKQKSLALTEKIFLLYILESLLMISNYDIEKLSHFRFWLLSDCLDKSEQNSVLI